MATKYIPVLDDSRKFIKMMKTTTASPADGDWSVADNANSPWVGPSSIISIWAYLDPNDSTNGKVYVFCQQTNARVSMSVFNTLGASVDTWTTSNQTVYELSTAISSVNPAVPDRHSVTGAVRSDGDIVVFFAVADGSGPSGRVIAISNTGSWGTPALFSPDSTCEAPVAWGPDGSDRIYCAYRESTLNVVKTRSSTDVNGTQTTIDSTVDNAYFSIMPGVLDSADKSYVPYVDADNKVTIANWAAADTPTVDVADTALSDDTILGNSNVGDPPYPAGCLAVDGTTVYCLYAEATTSDLQYFSGSDGSWGADTEAEAGTCNRVSANKGVSNILYVWDDGGVTKFGEIILAVPATQAFPHPISRIKHNLVR